MTVISMMMEIKQRNIIWDFSSEQQEFYFSSRQEREEGKTSKKVKEEIHHFLPLVFSSLSCRRRLFQILPPATTRHSDIVIREEISLSEDREREAFKEIAATFVVQKASSQVLSLEWKSESPAIDLLSWSPLSLSSLRFTCEVAGEGEKQQEKSTWSSLPAFFGESKHVLCPETLYITLFVLEKISVLFCYDKRRLSFFLFFLGLFED